MHRIQRVHMSVAQSIVKIVALHLPTDRKVLEMYPIHVPPYISTKPSQLPVLFFAACSTGGIQFFEVFAIRVDAVIPVQKVRLVGCTVQYVRCGVKISLRGTTGVAITRVILWVILSECCDP